jgi:hypothetical protein
VGICCLIGVTGAICLSSLMDGKSYGSLFPGDRLRKMFSILLPSVLFSSYNLT